MNILITRVNAESLSGHLYESLRYSDHAVGHLGHDFDITDWNSFPSYIENYDVVINCTGITFNESVLDMTPSDTLKVFQVNAVGAAMLTSYYAAGRRRIGLPGLIVHVGSIGARKVFTNCSAYCASKAALAHYIQCAGYELKKDKIAVVGVHPGNINGTKMTAQVQSELVYNRGMTLDQVCDIYKDAHNVDDVVKFILGVINMPWTDITGENFYMGQGWKG